VFEFANLFISRTEIVCLSCKALSYGDLSKIMLAKL
jgi:hypothetical protein